MKHTKRLAVYGLLVALAFILSYVESLFPVFFFVPGMKLGLANLAVFSALYLLGFRDAFVISMVRILLVAFTFSNTFSMLYSLAGGILSIAAMEGLKRTGKFSPVGVSVAGGTAHNIGQILVAAAVVKTPGVLTYLPVLFVAGIVTGLLIGVAAQEIMLRIGGQLKR